MLGRSSSRFLTIISSQCVPSRGKRIWVRKPLGSPIAPSKMFRLPVHPVIPDDEKAEIKRLTDNYRCQMNSLRQYLFEDACRKADTGDSAQLKMKLENEEHERLMEENRIENLKTAALREERLKVEAEITRERALVGLMYREKLVGQSASEFEAFLQHQQDVPVIRQEEIERKIEEALANPVDYNFAIDVEGYVYRGKETNIENIPETSRERLCNN